MTHQEETVSKLLTEAKDSNIDLAPTTLRHFELLLNMCYAAAIRDSYRGRRKPIQQLNKYGTVIDEFKSAAEAGRKLKINRVAISMTANGTDNRKTAGDYGWRWK